MTLVLPDAQDEVGGHAHLQGAVPPAGEEIDAWQALWVPAFAGKTVLAALAEYCVDVDPTMALV